MDKADITSPRKGGLSVYGTNVQMNITSGMGALPALNSQLTSFGDKVEKISGEYVKANVLVNDPTCHASPVACKKEVEIYQAHTEISRLLELGNGISSGSKRRGEPDEQEPGTLTLVREQAQGVANSV